MILFDCGITNLLVTLFSFALARAYWVDLSENLTDRRGLQVIAESMNGLVVGDKVLKAEYAKEEEKSIMKALKQLPPSS